MAGTIRAGVGGLALDPACRTVRRDGVEVHLTPKAFELLVLLVCAAPRVVPKAELHDRIWPGTFVSDATLVGVIKELRRALDGSEGTPSCIRTAHRIGYAFAWSVEGLMALPCEGRCWIVARGGQFPLRLGENLIGRDPACGVWLNSAGVSRRHARVEVGDVEVTIEDLMSKNGTIVNGKAVRQRVRLSDGDRVKIGAEVLVYRCAAGVSTETISRRRPMRKAGVERS